MKKILFTILISFLSLTVIYAQGHSIAYDINLAFNCDDMQGIIIESGSAMEGEFIEFPAYTIPSEYAILQPYQKLVDVFAGAQIEIPEGTLSEDVTFKIMLNTTQCEYENINLRELLGMTVKVVGSSTGEYPPMGYYEFNEGMFVTLKLKAENLSAYLMTQNMTIAQIIAWFITEGFEADLTGILLNYSLGDEWVYINLTHFSKIALGVDNTPTGLNSEEALPTEYKLGQNYPNPFNPTTKIAYSLPYSGLTNLTIYNSIGVEVETLVSEQKTAGNYEITFDGTNLSSGIYFYDLSSGNFRSTKKMILIK